MFHFPSKGGKCIVFIPRDFPQVVNSKRLEWQKGQEPGSPSCLCFPSGNGEAEPRRDGPGPHGCDASPSLWVCWLVGGPQPGRQDLLPLPLLSLFPGGQRRGRPSQTPMLSSCLCRSELFSFALTPFVSVWNEWYFESSFIFWFYILLLLVHSHCNRSKQLRLSILSRK